MPKMRYWNGTGWVTLDAANADYATTAGSASSAGSASNASQLDGKSAGEFAQSVNGKDVSAGTVTLTAADVGAAPVSHSHSATDLPNGTTSAKGVVQLSSATNSTSTTTAATSSAVKSAYDLAAGKLDSGGKAADSSKINGSGFSVGTAAPTTPATNDVWIDTN